MIVCKKCNKEYKEGLRFCPTCGQELETVETSSIVEQSQRIEKTPEVEKIEEVKNDSIISQKNDEKSVAEVNISDAGNHNSKSHIGKFCIGCGTSIEAGEKFCMKCGLPVDIPADKVKTEKSIKEKCSGIQNELLKVFQANKFFDFLFKYAIIFALYYPIYLLIGRIEALDGLSQVLDYISIVGFYGYYIGLIALYSKRNYLPMLIAFAIRFINSFILLFKTDVPITSICRITVLVFAFIYIFKKFSKTNQYQTIKSNFQTDSRTCSQCGATISGNDSFCPKCGNRL